VFGGLIGMLIVDPLTGAMYNLKPERIEQPLTAAQAEVIRNGNGVLVVLASQTTERERAEMLRIKRRRHAGEESGRPKPARFRDVVSCPKAAQGLHRHQTAVRGRRLSHEA